VVPVVSASYRFYIAYDAILATVAVDHCPFLPAELTLAGPSPRFLDSCIEQDLLREQLPELLLPGNFFRTRRDAVTSTPAPELEDGNGVRRCRLAHPNLQLGSGPDIVDPAVLPESSGVRESPLRKRFRPLWRFPRRP